MIVGLRSDHTPEGRLGAAARTVQRLTLAAAQARVLSAAGIGAQHGLHRYETIPFFAARIDESQLDALASHPDVASIRRDGKLRPSLAESVPLVGADDAWSAGFDGSNWAVAVIDSGVSKTHPFLADKVISEACYSTENDADGLASLCPGSVETSIEPGSASACDVSTACQHGTHVAGIAAGSGTSFSGVARGAKIIAIQVFTYDEFLDDLITFESDVLAALERVYEIRNGFNIAAVNLSLSSEGDARESHCDAEFEDFATVIGNLRSVGIATVVAAGNLGANNAIGIPACISTAVSVGATTKGDEIYEFSNAASFLDLHAPGVDIMSSVPGDGFALSTGTSMAAPHVSGAWAVLRQRAPTASVSTILDALTSTGIPITDPSSGVVTPRIRVDLALAEFSPPRVPTQVAPNGNVASTQPSFTWSPTLRTKWYHLWVNDSEGQKIGALYTPEAAGCASGTGNCRVSPGVMLTGSGAWWIGAVNDFGSSPWSAGMTFTISPTVAGSVLSVYPVSGAATSAMSRLWASVRNAGGLNFPAGTRVWFHVEGPGWTDNWVGSADVSGQAPGSNPTWYFFDWSIPASATPGDYSYRARIFTTEGPISPMSDPPMPFTVSGPPRPSTSAPFPYPVNGGSVSQGANAVLWARVTNNGSLTLPAGAKVWFYVDGPAWTGDHWVGATAVEGLAPGETQWYAFTWTVPMAATTGTYTYWAQVWSSGAISPFSTGMSFSVTP